MVESILAIVASLFGILFFWLREKARRRELTEAEVKRGEEAEAKAIDKAKGSSINDSIKIQDEARTKHDF